MGETRPPPDTFPCFWPIPPKRRGQGLLFASCLHCAAGTRSCNFLGLNLPICQMGRGLWESKVIERSVPPLLFSTLPWAVTHPPTHSGACATLWLLSPPLHPLRGAPCCPKPPNIIHIPPSLASRLLGQSPWTAGRGMSWAFLSLRRTLGHPAPTAKWPSPVLTGIPPVVL